MISMEQTLLERDLTEVRDAGTLEIDEAVLEFEAELDTELGAQACLVGGGFVSIYPTYVTICGKNS
jgi:hypothetical protein